MNCKFAAPTPFPPPPPHLSAPAFSQLSIAQQAHAKQTRHFAGGLQICCSFPQPSPSHATPPPPSSYSSAGRIQAIHATLQVDRHLAALLAVLSNAARTMRKPSCRNSTARPACSVAGRPCRLQLVSAVHRQPYSLDLHNLHPNQSIAFVMFVKRYHTIPVPKC